MANTERIDELKRRVQMDPASIAFAALAEEYRREGRFEEAIATCSTGLRRHPSYLSAHVTLGRAWASLGRIDEARAEFEHVLRLAPENLAAIRALAEIHNSTETAPEPRIVHEAGPASPPLSSAAASLTTRNQAIACARCLDPATYRRACRQHSWGSNTSSTRSLARGARTPTSSAPAPADAAHSSSHGRRSFVAVRSARTSSPRGLPRGRPGWIPRHAPAQRSISHRTQRHGGRGRSDANTVRCHRRFPVRHCRPRAHCGKDARRDRTGSPGTGL